MLYHQPWCGFRWNGGAARPSGSGKTTLCVLLLALNIRPKKYLFRGKDVSRLHAEIAKSVLFSSTMHCFAIWLLLRISFGLTVLPRRDRPNKEAIHKKSNSCWNDPIPHLAQRYPTQLSGGQNSMCPLRGFAVEPQILLLDEPFGASDAKVRTELRRWLRELPWKLKFTSVFVTLWSTRSDGRLIALWLWGM